VKVPFGDPLTAVIAPPQLADIASGPFAYVWGARLVAGRQTAPRTLMGGTGGQSKLVWDASVAVTQAIDPDDPNIDSAFPLVLDQIMATVMLTPLQQTGVYLTDPDTGNKTQLLLVGERYSLDYTVVSQSGPSGKGLWIYAADFTFPVEEVFSLPVGTFYNPTAPSA